MNSENPVQKALSSRKGRITLTRKPQVMVPQNVNPRNVALVNKQLSKA